MDIVQGLSAASTALSIAKQLREIDKSVDEATFKLAVADLTDALADTKIALSDAKVAINDLKTKIAELEKGDLCPVCKNSHLAVTKTEPSGIETIETHYCSCSNDDCNYSNKRYFNPTLGKYEA